MPSATLVLTVTVIDVADTVEFLTQTLREWSVRPDMATPSVLDQEPPSESVIDVSPVVREISSAR